MRLSSLTLLLITLALNALLWVGVNKPFSPVESRYPVSSFSLNPFKRHQSPFDQLYLKTEDLESDLKVLQGKTKKVRLYSATGGIEQLPELAKKYDMDVIASAYLDNRPIPNTNQVEVDSVIRMAQMNKNVTQVLIGNETQLHKTVPPEELLTHLRRARKELKTPVSTAEPWDFWINNPDMVKEVDFIAIHILPYWNEVPIDKAVDYVLEKYQAVKNVFPKKKILIAETGWPSDGPQKGAAEATLTNQATFVRDFVQRAKVKKIDYNLIEAFDQPWKSSTEGRVGEHWGIMDADRHDKFPMEGPVLEDPKWKYWAATSIILSFLACSVFFVRRQDLKKRGQLISIVVFQFCVAMGVQLAREASDQYMSPGDIAFWAVMITAQVLLAIIFLTDAVEIADVVGDKALKRKFLPHNSNKEKYPFVSLHLACCREPPDLVIATVNSLARLDYPNFEVIVVDNNTLDETLWRPVEERCKELGDRFKFFSLGKWPGFKAGALNFALKATSVHAKVIGVVDADYIVEPNWLKATIPHFEDDDNVAVVQAPQEHRAWQNNTFQTMENDEYSGFFRIGMVQRNEHNAIIQHGTMTLIDHQTLQELGGWAQWCICEDAELGLRILNEGKKTIYLDHAFGFGLVPNTFEAYAKQRFRWAYGAMTILRHHWLSLLGLKGSLSFSQRYQFVKGWLPWIGDALHLLFTILAIGWSWLLLVRPTRTDFPEPIFVYPAVGLVLLRIFGTFWTYNARVKIGFKRTIMAMIAGGALTHKIAKAVCQGMFTSSKPFYRTPKMESAAPIIQSLLAVWEEITLALCLYVFSFLIIHEYGWINKQAVVWSMALLIQTLPYLAAVTSSLISTFSIKTEKSNLILDFKKP